MFVQFNFIYWINRLNCNKNNKGQTGSKSKPVHKLQYKYILSAVSGQCIFWITKNTFNTDTSIWEGNILGSSVICMHSSYLIVKFIKKIIFYIRSCQERPEIIQMALTDFLTRIAQNQFETEEYELRLLPQIRDS